MTQPKNKINASRSKSAKGSLYNISLYQISNSSNHPRNRSSSAATDICKKFVAKGQKCADSNSTSTTSKTANAVLQFAQQAAVLALKSKSSSTKEPLRGNNEEVRAKKNL